MSVTELDIIVILSITEHKKAIQKLPKLVLKLSNIKSEMSNKRFYD